MNALRRLFYGLIALAAVQVIYYYPQIPQVVASHFDGRGARNGWSSRNAAWLVHFWRHFSKT